MGLYVGSQSIAPDEAPADGVVYSRSGGQWRPLGLPGFSLTLSDVANTSGDVSGSTADTGQAWVVSGTGAIAPRKPIYASDSVGGYMRATEVVVNAGDPTEANTYVYGATTGVCKRLAVRKRGVTCTIALLKTANNPEDMIHVNFTQSTGHISPNYWKTGVGPAQNFAYFYSLGLPDADPNRPRWYEVEVVGSSVVCYVDGQLVGVVSDPVIPGIVGGGFYTQLHTRDDRVYEIKAWDSQSTPSLGEHATVTALAETGHVRTRGVHVGNAASNLYTPASNFFVSSDAPTFKAASQALAATFQGASSGYPGRLRVYNGDGVGIEIEGGAGFNGVIRHQTGNRIEFPVNVSRVDFPVAVKARSVAHVVALTYSATVTTDATAGDVFDLTLTGNVTIANPTNPLDGKTLTWRVLQDGTGGRTVALGNKFVVPSTITSPLGWGSSANVLSVMSATYHAARDRWHVVSFHTGY